MLDQWVALVSDDGALRRDRMALTALRMKPPAKKAHKNPKPTSPAVLSTSRAQRTPRTKIVTRNT